MTELFGKPSDSQHYTNINCRGSLNFEECSICIMSIKTNMIQLSKCGNFFHKSCINQVVQPKGYSITYPRCPNCKALFSKSFVQDTMCYYQSSGSGTEPSEQ